MIRGRLRKRQTTRSRDVERDCIACKLWGLWLVTCNEFRRSLAGAEWGRGRGMEGGGGQWRKRERGRGQEVGGGRWRRRERGGKQKGWGRGREKEVGGGNMRTKGWRWRGEEWKRRVKRQGRVSDWGEGEGKERMRGPRGVTRGEGIDWGTRPACGFHDVKRSIKSNPPTLPAYSPLSPSPSSYLPFTITRFPSLFPLSPPPVSSSFALSLVMILDYYEWYYLISLFH